MEWILACRERKVLEGEVRQMQEDMQALVEADMEAQQVCYGLHLPMQFSFNNTSCRISEVTAWALTCTSCLDPLWIWLLAKLCMMGCLQMARTSMYSSLPRTCSNSTSQEASSAGPLCIPVKALARQGAPRLLVLLTDPPITATYSICCLCFDMSTYHCCALGCQ